MNPYRLALVSSLLVAATHIAPTLAADAASLSPQAQVARHADAVQSFRARRCAAAHGRFAAAADAGHLPSAPWALLMHAHGRELLGSDWSATPDQRRRWNTLVSNAARQRVALPDTGQRGD
jgi:hypothetical protein